MVIKSICHKDNEIVNLVYWLNGWIYPKDYLEHGMHMYYITSSTYFLGGIDI